MTKGEESLGLEKKKKKGREKKRRIRLCFSRGHNADIVGTMSFYRNRDEY